MNIEFDNDKPIYLQLIEYIKIEIIKGNYKPGEKIPSVRHFAILLKVNPNTINRALKELEDDGLIVTQRTNGKFVTDNKKIVEKIKNNFANQKVVKFIKDLETLGISKAEIIKLIKGDC